MQTQIHTISKENYPQIIEWLEHNFNEIGLSQKEIYKGELLLEENFYHFATASGDEHNFRAQVEIKKHFGEVSIRLIAPGKAYKGSNDKHYSLKSYCSFL